MMLVNNATMDAFGICIYGILVLSVACRETVQEDLVSLQLSVNIWATTDFPEAAKPTQESGSSQRMSKSFVTGRQEDQMCAQNLFCGLFSPLFYHRSKFCRTIFHLHGHKHDQLSSSAQQRFHPTWGYIQSLTDTCIVAVPLLGTPTQLPAPSQNRGQSSQAVLAQESWAVRRGLSQPQCTWWQNISSLIGKSLQGRKKNS